MSYILTLLVNNNVLLVFNYTYNKKRYYGITRKNKIVLY